MLFMICQKEIKTQIIFKKNNNTLCTAAFFVQSIIILKNQFTPASKQEYDENQP